MGALRADLGSKLRSITAAQGEEKLDISTVPAIWLAWHSMLISLFLEEAHVK